MAKKEVFQEAAAGVGAMPIEQAAKYKPGFIGRIVGAPFRALNIPFLPLHWFNKSDKLVWLNIALIGVLIVMFVLMFFSLRSGDDKTPKLAAPKYDLAARLEKRDRPNTLPTEVARLAGRAVPQTQAAPAQTRNKQVAFKRGQVLEVKAKPAIWGTRPQVRAAAVPTLPLAQNQRQLPARPRRIQGTVMVDGRGQRVVLQPMTEISGDLILQNMRTFTLPCGTRVGGHLILRNVDQLKFCNQDGHSFTVRGNIYVSRNSSFGPLPRTARLGGQVIF